MRDPKRIPKILKEIEKIWEKCPDMRLGQLIANVLDSPNLYYTEDDDLVKYMEFFYAPDEARIRFIKNYVAKGGFFYSDIMIKILWEDFSSK